MSSAAKLAKPGRPTAAMAANPKSSPKVGIALASPPSSAKSSVPVRSRSSPLSAKSAAMESPCATSMNAAPANAERLPGQEAQEKIAHMHDARVAEHEIELALRDRDKADVEDVSENEDKKKSVERRR